MGLVSPSIYAFDKLFAKPSLLKNYFDLLSTWKTQSAKKDSYKRYLSVLKVNFFRKRHYCSVRDTSESFPFVDGHPKAKPPVLFLPLKVDRTKMLISAINLDLYQQWNSFFSDTAGWKTRITIAVDTHFFTLQLYFFSGSAPSIRKHMGQ